MQSFYISSLKKLSIDQISNIYSKMSYYFCKIYSFEFFLF